MTISNQLGGMTRPDGDRTVTETQPVAGSNRPKLIEVRSYTRKAPAKSQKYIETTNNLMDDVFWMRFEAEMRAASDAEKAEADRDRLAKRVAELEAVLWKIAGHPITIPILGWPSMPGYASCQDIAVRALNRGDAR